MSSIPRPIRRALRPVARVVRRMRAGGATAPAARTAPGATPSGGSGTVAKKKRKAPPRPDAQVRADLVALTRAGRHDEAIALATERFEEFAAYEKFLRQVRMSAAKGGAISLQRRAAHRLAELLPEDPKLAAVNAGLEGRWRETDAAWSPTIDPAVDATLPASLDPVPGRVLHVLKISMPHRQSGYSVRTMYTLTGELEVGLEPVAVTALDFPASVGVTDAASSEEVGGVRHRRLLRETVRKNQPHDAYLDEWATALAPVVAEERPEIIHVHSGHRGFESALVALAVGERFGIPVVYEVRGFFEAAWTSDLAWAERGEMYERRRATETRAMTRAAGVVTLSESMRQDIIERGVPADRVTVVPNGVNIEAFPPSPRDSDLAGDLGLQGRFVFGYVSNLDHYREGQELLIDAAVELNRRGVPATALIVGDGARREILERHAEEMGAGSEVVFTGRVPHDQVRAYYAQYDVFVIPRVDERAARLVTPLKPFEAMSSRIPVVVSDLPALQEITGYGERGATFRTGDGDHLADVLQELAQDPERREHLAQAGRDWVVSERQWTANGVRYRDLYRSIVDA